MTKGKLVFAVLLSVLACIDITHIYMYGSPFKNNPTGYQLMVGSSIIIAGFMSIVMLVRFIISNWEEPFKKRE